MENELKIIKNRFLFDLRNFLEQEGYRDGIQKILKWQYINNSIIGQFLGQNKIFDFSISNKGISYNITQTKMDSYTNVLTSLLNEITAGVYFDSSHQLSTAYIDGYLNRIDAVSKAKQCTSPTSYACGRTCISDKDKCHIRSSNVQQHSQRAIAVAKQITLKLSSGSNNKTNTISNINANSNIKANDNVTLKNRLKSVENDIRLLDDHEDMVALDVNGKVITRISGKETSVLIPGDVVPRLRGSVMTHNHPTWRYSPDDPRVEGRSFSLPDVTAAHALQLKEIRAVAPGRTYSLKPGEKGWGNYKFQIQPTYTKNAVLTHFELSKRVRKREITPEQAEAEFQGLIIQKTAKDLGWIYTEEKRDRTSSEKKKSRDLVSKFGAQHLPGSSELAGELVAEGLGAALKGALIASVVASTYTELREQRKKQLQALNSTTPVRNYGFRRRR